MNAFDEVANEAALQIRDGKLGALLGVQRVVALGVSLVSGAKPNPKEQQSLDDERRALRHALAQGANSATHIVVTDCDKHTPDFGPLCVSRALASYARETKPKLLLTGMQSTDRCDGCVPQMTAQMLGWLQCGPATALQASKTKPDSMFSASLEGWTSGSAERLMGLPAVVSCHIRMNTPRLVKLQNVLKTKKMPIGESTVSAEKLFADGAAAAAGTRARIVASQEAPHRARKKQIVKSTQQLVDALKHDGILP